MFDPALTAERSRADTTERRPVLDRSDVRGPRVPRGFTMNVSPLDLRQQRFRKAFRGFDRVEVTAFLVAVADDYEQALRETDRLRQELMRLEVVLAENRGQEK